MFSKAKRFQNIPSESGRKKLDNRCSTVAGKCEALKAGLRREGTFVVSKGNTVSRKLSPAQSTTNPKDETGVIYKSERCIIRRSSQGPNTRKANSSTSKKSTPSHSPNHYGSGLHYSSDRCTIRRTSPKVDVNASSKESMVNGTSPNNSLLSLPSKTLEIELSSNIYKEADKDEGRLNSFENKCTTKSNSSSIQEKTSNRRLQAVQGVKGFDIRISSPNIFDGEASLHSSSESLSLTGVEIKISSSNLANNLPKSDLSKTIQSSLNHAVRKLRLLSNEVVSKMAKETETRLDNLKSELKQHNLTLAKKLEFDNDNVLHEFTATVLDELGSQDNEQLRNINEKLRHQLKDAISKNTRLENMYKKVCKDNAKKQTDQLQLIEQLKAEVEAMEIAYRMKKISRYFPENFL